MVAMDAGHAEKPGTSAPLPLPPAWLSGRYSGSTLRIVVPDDASRTLDIGALIFRDADQSDPLAAIGVVVRIVDGKAIALVAGAEGDIASAREAGRAIGIRLAGPYGATSQP